MPTLQHPYHDLDSCRLLRGNLHGHTTRSDGAHSPQGFLDDYARLGYDFVAMTDHDLHLPMEEAAGWDTHGMVLLPGNEVTEDGPHFCHLNAHRTVPTKWMRQKSIDAALADPDSLVVLNHPNWWQNFDHWPVALMAQMHGFHGLEVFNGIMIGEIGSAYALEKWDQMLWIQRRPIWALANDDTHDPEDVGRGWNMVWARDKTAPAILDALRQGRFYPSTGVVIRSIQVDGLRLRVETTNAQRLILRRELGRRVLHVDGPVLDVAVPADAAYVRVECLGGPEQFAWTQAMWLQ